MKTRLLLLGQWLLRDGDREVKGEKRAPNRGVEHVDTQRTATMVEGGSRGFACQMSDVHYEFALVTGR